MRSNVRSNDDVLTNRSDILTRKITCVTRCLSEETADPVADLCPGKHSYGLNLAASLNLEC